MEEHGVKTKITRRLSEVGPEKKTAKQICHICSDKAKMLNCIVCYKPACNLHSIVTAVMSQSRVCDICFREEALKCYSADSNHREKLAQEISSLADLRDSNTQTLNKSSAKIRSLEKEIQDRENSYKDKISVLQQRIDKTKNEAKSEAESLPSMQKEKLDNEMQLEVKRQKLEGITEEYKKVKAEVDLLVKERTSLVGELNEISDFIRSYVPVKILRQAVCNPCYQQVRHAFVQVFKPVVPIKEEVQGKMSVKNIPNRKAGVCTSCEVF